MSFHRDRILTVIVATAIACFAPQSLAQSEKTENNFSISNVNVVGMDSDRILENQTVVVYDGAIQSVSDTASTTLPAEMVQIDGTDMFLMPGLADLHVHIFHEDEFVNYLAWGVTTVMHLGGSGLPGSKFLEYRQQIEAGTVIGPNIYTTDRVFDGSPRLNSQSLEITDPETARQEVRNLKQQGFDFVKIYNNIAEPEFLAIVDEARKAGLAVIGHIPRKFDPRTSLSSGQNAVAHTEELFFTYFGGPRATDQSMSRDYRADMTTLSELVDILVENDVAMMPDLSFTFTDLIMWDDLDILWNDPEFPYLHPATASMWQSGNINRRGNIENFVLREQWKYELMLELTRAFQGAGILQVVGTDAALPGLFPGKATHREMTELIKAGLSNYEALAVGTKNAGEFIHKFIDDDVRVGQILPGYQADLVLLTKNPLDDIRNARSVAGVVVNGQYVDKAELDATRDRLRSRYTYLRGANDAVDTALGSVSAKTNIAKIKSGNSGDTEFLSIVQARINAAGYAAANAGNLARAEQILRLNTEMFPHSANTWDSLAELTLYQGDRATAIELYRRALQADPGFRNAEEQIQKILSESESE